MWESLALTACQGTRQRGPRHLSSRLTYRAPYTGSGEDTKKPGASWHPADHRMRMFDAQDIRASCDQPLQTHACWPVPCRAISVHISIIEISSWMQYSTALGVFSIFAASPSRRDSPNATI